MTKKPLVSVVMPVHNYEDYIGEAIESVIAQTYKNWELIIVDDGSTDRSLSIIKKFVKKYPKKIKVIINKEAQGYGGEVATNQAIKKASGKYIAKMDADDVSCKNRFEVEVCMLEKNPKLYLVGSQATVIDKKGKKIGERRVPLNHDDILKEFFFRSCVIHPSIMFRNPGKNEDFYKIKFEKYNDYYTFFRLMMQDKKFQNSNKFLLKYRNHGKNSVYVNIKKVAPINMEVKKSFINEFGYRPPFKYLLLGYIQHIITMIVPDPLLIFGLKITKQG